MNSLTITKRYNGSAHKAAHRQWRHKGRCAFYHSECWTFEIEFIASSLDEQGFILDFGAMHFAKVWLAKMFDHTMLVEQDDPLFKEIMAWDNRLAQLRVVPSSSAEGLAKYVAAEINKLVVDHTKGRVQVKSVTCYEDEKNSARYEREIKWS